MSTEWLMKWTDATKEEPKDKSYIYVWRKSHNPKWLPNISDIYFENNKYWYDSSKISEFDAIVLAWCYTTPPEWIKYDKDKIGK